ncbi:MAG: hypothetical protein ABIO51_04515 [Solirubrobacteraceae bacterium]
MQSRKPSPALVVSIIALVVALGGTAVAAKVLITSSSQIKNRTISGLDLRNGAITKRQISKSTLKSLAATSGGSGGSDSAAIEAHRLTGPDVPDGMSTQVIELALQPGVYAVFAKTTITPFIPANVFDELLGTEKIISAECALDVNGTGDFATQGIASRGATNPATLNTQATRTLDAPGKATLVCKTSKAIHWAASNASIVAMKVGSTSRIEVP